MNRWSILAAGLVVIATVATAKTSLGHHPYGCWQPVTTYYAPTAYVAPVYTAPAPVVVYRPAVVTVPVAPVAVSRTRYRPILGGTVTRVRYGYAPAPGLDYRHWYPLY